MKASHCGTPGKPYVKFFGSHNYMTGLRCLVDGALFLPSADITRIERDWKAGEAEREQLRLDGIAFDQSLTS